MTRKHSGSGQLPSGQGVPCSARCVTEALETLIYTEHRLRVEVSVISDCHMELERLICCRPNNVMELMQAWS